MSFKNITFILHKPQLSENIGACARALKNFNFKNLSIVNPKPSFPNDKIIATSVGAKDVIKKAKVYENLETSLNNLDLLVATSVRFRNKNIKHISITDLNKINYKKKVGFLFGSEASGLSNNEVSYADYTLQIPSNKNFRSLNLSHSLIIVAQIVSGLNFISFNSIFFCFFFALLAFFCASYLYLPMSIILQTGGFAFGAISIKSKPSFFALLIASFKFKIPKFSPSLAIT